MNDRKARWLALYALCLGDLMIVLDTNIVNVALPTIQTELGFSPTALAWVVNAYMLTFGGFLLLSGRLGRPVRQPQGPARRRRRRSPSASVACALAPNAQLLVVGRAIQGLGGAAVSAVALALIMGLFSDPAERAKAMGVFGFVMSGGGAVGVLLGGVLTGLLTLAVDLPGQRADRHRGLVPGPAPDPGRHRLGRRPAPRRARRRSGHRLPDARRVRRRRRQRGRLDLHPHPGHPRRGRGRPRGVPGPRGAHRPPADAAAPLHAAQRRGLAGRRRAVGRRDVRLASS